MLFLPEENEGFRQKAPQSAQTVDAGVAAGAERDEEIGLADAGRAVVDAQSLPRPAAAAPETIPQKDGIAVAGSRRERTSSSLAISLRTLSRLARPGSVLSS
jgi:hypothetical protein